MQVSCQLYRALIGRASAVAVRWFVGQNFRFVVFDTRRNRTFVPQRQFLPVRIIIF